MLVINLCVITPFFTIELPSQQPDKCVHGSEQYKTNQDRQFALPAAEISFPLYPSMDNEKMNGRCDYQ